MTARTALLLLVATSAGAQPLTTSSSTQVVRGPSSGPSRLERGARTPLVTADFFCTLSSSHCARAERTLRTLAARYPDDLRIIYRMIDPPQAPGRRLAHAAHEAARPGNGAHLRFLEAAFAEPTAPIDALARRAGLDPAPLVAAIEARRHDAALLADQRLRDLLGGDVVPVAFLNGEVHVPFVELSLLERAFLDARTRAEERIAAGVPRRRLYREGLAAAVATRARELRAAAAGGRGRPTPDGDGVRVHHDPRGAAVRVEDNPQVADAGAVTLVYFADLDTSIGRRQLITLLELARREPGRMQVMVRLLPNLRSDSARRVAAALACARAAGRFWPFADRILTQSTPGSAGRDQLVVIAQAAGMDPGRFAADLNNGRCDAALAADRAAAVRAGIESAPAFIVGGWRLVGFRTPADLMLLVTDELRPGWLGRALDVDGAEPTW